MASQNAPEGFRFHHTGVRVADLDRSIAFYSGIFGMKEVARMDMDTATLVFLADPDTAGGVLELVYSKKPAATTTSSGDHLVSPFVKLAFGVPDVPTATQYMKSKNVKVLKEAGIAEGPEAVSTFVGCKQSDLKLDDQLWNGLTAVSFIQDPDGYLIEIIPNSVFE
ncbi:hypothetical protein BFJ69_g15341 [Fusarium oxysporum]|uniref:VOC domain-containing protein n=1 Tax=Fusarium oxysporum TaxID=5507 RepID=A0A420MEL5_FUSOX|nr:hypothetical protein BFJ69_g15341 [Fusarium oxysporum]